MAVLIPTMTQPNEAALAELSNRIGRPLPQTYIEFVTAHDGARPSGNRLITSNNEISIVRFIPVSEAARFAGMIDGFPTEVIPLAEDDCGNFLYVDPASEVVRFWDHEVEGSDEQVALSALAVAEALLPYDASETPLAPGRVKRVWVNPSFKPEF